MKKIKEAIQVNRYNPDYQTGLTEEQVKQRFLDGLNNKKAKNHSKSVFGILFSNIFTFFNLLGTIVAIALVIVKAPLSQFFFVLIYIANILIGVIQELRAKVCIDKLSLLSRHFYTVIRDGKKVNVLSNDIVLDDIIELGLGAQIPVDCILQNGFIEVNESLLTGESLPIKKNIGDIIYAGSFITTGICYAKADKISQDCYVAKLATKAKQFKKPQSELMNSLRLIIKIVGMLIVPIGVALVLKSILNGVDVVLAIQHTSTSIIGMIPSGMLLLTSMALAVGVIKLATQKTLVQDLYSLETLARVDTICFDKTGTLTDGKMNVNDTFLLYDFSSNTLKKIMSSMLFALKDNNQTANALKNYFGDEKYFQPTITLPFNSKRKLSAVTFHNLGTFAFGAPEFLLNSEDYNKLKEYIDHFAGLGLRVIAVAQSQKQIENDIIPNDISPIALITIVDNIREDAIKTVSWFNDNDVEIKVISGDNALTVSEIALRTGIKNADKYISLEGLTDDEVINSADKYTVFGRVSPEQKALIIKTLKSCGHVTAMTGDGVNDILAMKEADCAISVASGSEASRNVSNIVLLDDNFSSMPKVVYEGRRVINNVQDSASLYLMKTLFTIILSIIILCIPSRTEYPFKLSQMILLEVFVIGLPSFFLSLQPNDNLVKGRFLSHVLKRSIPSALIMVLSVLAIEIAKKYLGYTEQITEQTYVTMGIIVINYAGLINLFFLCRPFNMLRTTIFTFCFTIITSITVYSIFKGFNLLQLTAMYPLFPDFWHHILLVVCIILADIPIYLILRKILNKVNVVDKLFNLKNKKTK